MSSFRDLVKKVNEQKETVSSYGQEQSSQKGGSFRDLVKNVNNGTIKVGSTLNSSQVNSWFSGVKKTGQEAYNYLASEGYKAPDTSYLDAIASYLDQANDIGQFVRANRDAFENYEETYNSYADTVNYLRSLQDSIKKSNEIFSKYKTEEEYQADVDRWNAYYDAWGHYEEEEDFDSTSANRNFVNPTDEDLSYYDAMMDYSSWRTDYSTGKMYDAFGNLIPYVADDKGNIIHPMQNDERFVVNDPLGMFLATSSDDRDAVVYGGEQSGKKFEVLREGAENHWEQLKSEEISMYYYLMNTQGKDVAMAYLRDTAEMLNARWGSLKAQEISNIDNGFEKFVVTGLFGLQAGVDQWGTGIAQILNGEASPTSGMQYANAEIANSLDGLGKYAYQAANTVGNMLPSILISKGLGMSGLAAGEVGKNIIKGVGAFAMGSSAGGNAYGQALKEGYSEGQARTYGTLVGASEALLEYLIGGISDLGGFGTEKILSKLSAIDKTFLRISAKLGVNIGSEITEEIAQNYLEPLFRKFIFSEEYDAPTFAENLETALVTALSTGVLEGGNTIVGDVAETQKYRDVGRDIMGSEGSVDALKNLANEVAGVSDAKMQKTLTNKSGNVTGEIATGKNIVGKAVSAIKNASKAEKIGRLYSTVVDANNQANASANQADIAKSLQRKGFNAETANDIASALVAEWNGQELTKAQEKLLKSAKDSKVVQDAISNIMENEQSTMGQRSQNIRDFQQDVKVGTIAKRTGVSKDMVKALIEVAENGGLSTDADSTADVNYEVSVDGKWVNNKTGDAVEPHGLVQAEDGTYMINAKDADPVASGEVSYPDADHAIVYETLMNLERHYGKTSRVIADMDLASRNELLGLYNPNVNKSGGKFIKGILDAFFYGHRNVDMSAASKDSPIWELTEQQRKIAWNTGRAAGIKTDTEVQSNIDTVYAEAKQILESGKAKKGSYHAVLEDGISPTELNEKQRAIYRYADDIAQGIQTKIRVYKGKNKAQGFYNHETEEIWLNLNAANADREHIMAFTLAHELVHRAKKGSHNKYMAFTEFLLKEYGKQGADVDAMIAEQIEAAERFNKTVPESQRVNMTREKALEEVICDACQRMLLDTNAGQKLAEFGAQSKENKGFLEDLKRWITELLDRLRNYFRHAKPDSLAGQAFDKFDANVKQMLADMYVDMSIDAGEKLSTIKAAFGEEFASKFFGIKDIRYNLAAVDSHKAKLQKQYSEDSSTDLKTIMARYDKIIEIWNRLGGELNSKFLADWNSKVGKDRTFTIFKAQVGYKYNVELSSMCKKGVPLFEAIDTIVKQEVMKELNTEVLGKAEKEILYDILKRHSFEIPCAICYVEQARQREGVVIDAFLNGKVEKNAKGQTTKVKLGWNQVLDSIQKEMKANGVDYTFAQVSRDIATEKYSPANLDMDMKTQVAFYAALKKIANQEIARYNKAEGKSRKLLKEVTPEAVKECFKGTIPANLKIFKVLFNEPSSRFKIQNDLLYSSIATQNLSMAHNELYGLFNSQGGVSGYKTKQGTTIYWGDILGKSWKPDTVRDEGGVRNQSNSDFQMYTLLDQAQMYIDFTAKGYYLQAYTKVLSELKLFGLSRGKINASLIPKVVVYKNADGSDNVEKTMATAGLDENGNPIYDDIEGINHTEAFMLIEDPEYSKSICGICIGYSDAHINKLLDDSRVQQIIGFHDKTDDGTKRYKGARYAKNYNGLNEATKVDSEGKTKTVHIGFNSYVKRAEKKFKFNAETETFEGTINYNGKTYTADDIPRLAADLYLEMCAKKGYTPAYNDFSGHRNYYKLLADFGLYDSQGHYAPHRKVLYNMPDTVPYLDANGKKQTMRTDDYIKAELKKELAVRDSIAAALADTSSEGIIPQFKAAVKKSQEEKNYSLPKTDSDGNQLSAEQQEFFKDSVVRDADGKLMVMYHGTANGGAFTVFDGDKLGNRTLTSQIGQGFYFTNVKKEAESYMKNVDIYGRVSNGTNPNLHQVYLNITNPFNVTADTLDIEKAKSVYMDGNYDYFFDSYIPFYMAKKTLNGRTFTKADIQAMSKADKVSAYVDYLSLFGTKEVLSNMVQAFHYNTQSKLLTSMKNRLGYDGIVEEFKPGQYQYVAFSSEQIKNVDNTTPTTDPDIRYSLPKGDQAYMDAVNRGDIDTVQKMVDEAAKKAGYDSFVYHGTPRFGFTKIKTEGVEDGVEWSPFFATDSMEVAETYSGKSKVRGVSDNSQDDTDAIAEAFRDRVYDLCDYINRAAGYQSYIAYDAFDSVWEDAADGTLSLDVIRDSFYEDVESIVQELFAYSEYYKQVNYPDVDQDDLYEQFVESDEVDRIYSAMNDIDFILRGARAANSGNYQFYANTENLFEIDAKGNSWSRIPFDEYDKNGFHPYVNTRQAAVYAKQNGFDGVKVSNVFDDGGRSVKKQRKPATVYIFLAPQKQVKSADPVTYDDKGKVIPLSERFNVENDDIRYSLPKREPAPTFYSQMARVVDGVKQEKLGAASVVSMLRGKGVKAEEIKWSGIEAFLEGKKSVTKAELQEFIAGSMLQIEEEILSDDEIPYTEDQQKRLDEHTAKRDNIAQRLAAEWKRITGDEFPIQNVGAGLESAVEAHIRETNAAQKNSTFEYRLLTKLRSDLKEVIERNDDFGFDSWKQALQSIYRNRKDFIPHYEMSTNDKAVIVKFCNALNAYNELPNKISDADTDTLRGIAHEAELYNRKIGDVKSEHSSEYAKRRTKWNRYSLVGGENYREILFKMPGSDYYNDAMAMHWEEREGVLAHARIQDLNTFLGKMLFIEEIQSDWHNDGHKDGYAGEEPAVRKRISELSKQWDDLLKESRSASDERADEINEKLDAVYEEKERLQSKMRYGRLAPDAPFKDNYHEYVLKRLIRMAAEQDYDSIGWTTAQTQVERWSKKYAEGYRIEYDQDIPKFLNKYGKKWGTQVGKTVLDNGTEVWSMAITDEMKDSVLYEGQVVYSLPKVSPVQPSTDKWSRTHDTDEVKAQFPDLWDVSADESEVRNPTQISGTVKSYRKIYEYLKAEGFNGSILDASSGLGYGTKAGIEEYGFDVEDIEPYPDKSYSPKYTDYSALDKKYDVIISNAVLNVLPQDQRDALVIKMASMLKDGGRIFINVRGRDVENASSKVAINKDLMEYYISNTGSYQKGFTKPELVAYLEDALGDGYRVSPTGMFGAVSAVVTKTANVQYSLPKTQNQPYRKPAYDEWDVSAALDDALDHADHGDDNLILVGEMPHFVSDLLGIEGDFYIYRNHVYENMVSLEQAIEDHRPTKRKKKAIHFHNLGKGKVQNAIMALEHPIMTIADSSDTENPQIVMVLPVLGNNDAPLYAALSFYSDQPINGALTRKPHIVLTIAERGFFAEENHDGYVEVINNAVDNGIVISYDKEKMRDYLSVIADHTRVGNITEKSLKENLAQFIKKIKSFKEKNHIDYKLPVDEDASPRALLANAFEGLAQNDSERNKIQEYKEKVALINAEEQKLNEINAQIKELSFAKGKRDTKKISALRFDAVQAANRINTYDKQLLRLEASKPLQDVLAREKRLAYKKAEQRGKEALKAYREAERRRDEQWHSEVKEKYQASKKKAIDTREKREAREKLQKLVLDTVKWITYPTKTDVKCPDILKQPYADFLNGIDLSSKRVANGGDPTKNDLRLANAMGSLATALDRIMTAQDPAQDSDKVLDTGYLDLPADFVQKLRDMTENIKAMMVEGDYVVNTMTASEVRQLSQMIRTLNHAIKTMSKLYANLRFANIEALGFDTMEFMDALGEIEKTGGMKDFVQWDNALPYYAFKRFGKGGESVFEGLMDAQDKLAFLAQVIFDFQEKTWTGEEAKAWSEDTHTITLPNGSELTLTTADAMSIYCLSRREQGLQHLLGGGTRVMGLQKGSQKAKDSRSLLTIEDISAIISSLTDRQKQVAEGIQEFMSTVCSEWGNEISMKRFLTKDFSEKFYFPIESNDENLPTKDPAAQQSDLFRLLNISATKPLTPGANNEVIIRNIFDVFTGHASDMARLNAYGMALLDYMKWLNYREKTVTDEGQINVRGVRKSMEQAYGNAAKSYVLNLVKDVNGRPSDGGDPNILMKWMRAAKTAGVGSSLRVATLQLTSYPRAALVLSPKSLALGLSKMPNINRAKKYCGIALWKSFGFYDTNISRSIEDQMKGVTDIKQKLIELSLKGAEWGDAITWGALWNACEYEVAQTTKNKIGSEEFYQEVANKLREVVYRTQVVDSTLTRSQIMRSKRGMAQEAAAFMSEPTLSANILMDAGFEFNAEKRRTGSAKAAWNKTGKYIGRAVAVYAIGQLTAALLEGFWDAWRDEDDEEFGEKYWSAFVQNLVLDLLPLNKLPILSDAVDLALSQFGLGFYSSDRMSTTWLTQTDSALKAWKDALSGESSVTVYNALYKTVRAISSFFGVSVSGVMREGVALWNNTAGAYDPTLKILTYDRSKEELGELLLDAIIEGNDRQAESLKAEFADEDAYSSAIRTAIKNRYGAGDLDADTAKQYLVEYGGLDESDAYWKVEEWQYETETGEDFRKYNDFYEAVQTGKNLKTVIKEYTDNGVESKTLASQITSYFKPLYKEMSNSERAAIKGYLLNAYELLGYDRSKKSKDIDKWVED